ncbi:response regulator [Pseudenhygromyxa sp. WMMC2535]|uniref:response regulator n=1 Tax=Pseudenhygromyxa sp. WMMC2535 TaxID=2712867 RepID=UPI001553B18C|nr:response regulator [Pseudenhygromyxa sp. WMMC2535]NVB37063.1 response regulator [Pseudenhygromyxa sp. WMMC2535]
MNPLQPHKLRIFLIEDDEIDAENVRRALIESERPITLDVARDGQEAIDRIRSGAQSLEHTVILLDLNMPRMNGIEFLEALRNEETHSSTPVVVLTTSDSERDKVQAYGFNVAGYILKPVTFKEFVKIMKVIESYWRMQEFP